jgi:hypothetical protein
VTLLASRQHNVGASLDAVYASEVGALPFALVTTLTASGLASSEAFGTAATALRYTMLASSLDSSEAFGSSTRTFPKGATGTHPATNDARTTVTGPEDLSGKNFTNPVTLAGSGLTGTRVAFAKKPIFQDCSAVLSDVWFDQNGSAGSPRTCSRVTR